MPQTFDSRRIRTMVELGADIAFRAGKAEDEASTLYGYKTRNGKHKIAVSYINNTGLYKTYLYAKNPLQADQVVVYATVDSELYQDPDLVWLVTLPVPEGKRHIDVARNFLRTHGGKLRKWEMYNGAV